MNLSEMIPRLRIMVLKQAKVEGIGKNVEISVTA
jgi:hypothetical protein